MRKSLCLFRRYILFECLAEFFRVVGGHRGRRLRLNYFKRCASEHVVRSLRNAAPLTDPFFRAHRSSPRETTERFRADEVIKKEKAKRKTERERRNRGKGARYLTRRKARDATESQNDGECSRYRARVPAAKVCEMLRDNVSRGLHL